MRAPLVSGILLTLALLGLTVTLFLHVLAWTGESCQHLEWPLRVLAFVAFGIAVLMARAHDKRRRVDWWRTALRITPRWVLAISILLYSYWAVSLIFFVLFRASSPALVCQDLTARLIMPWVLAAEAFYVAASGSRDS